ncbi:hypothetical protein SUGI_0713620 [Cryptomeria japonica]|nr:hypothetical protein SUGI_0713620 [Cryptomeria japonica]
MKLKIKVKVLYVGKRPIHIWTNVQEEDAYEMKRKAMSNIPNLSFLDAYKLWQRVVDLYNDLSRMKDDEKILKVRRLVSGLLKKSNRDVGLIVIDEDGEMVTARGKEMVEVLLKGGKDEEELLCDIKNKGLKQVLDLRWNDDIVSNSLYH